MNLKENSFSLTSGALSLKKSKYEIYVHYMTAISMTMIDILHTQTTRELSLALSFDNTPGR